MSTIIFTPLPNGRSGNKLRLSVFTTFRLTSANGRFDGLGSDVRAWPSTDIAFQVSIGGGDPVDATDVTPVDRRADLWSSLFEPGSPVDEHEEADDLTGSRVRSIPASKVESFFKDALTGLATSHPREVPPLRVLKQRFEPLVYKDEEERLLALESVELTIQTAGTTRFTLGQLKTSIKTVAALGARRRVGRRASRAAQSDAEKSIRKALISQLESTASRSLMTAAAVIDPRFVPEPGVRIAEDFGLSFHESVSALNGHPFLLRTFGIVRDLEIDLPSSITKSLKLVDVQLLASWNPRSVVSKAFVTKTVIGAPSSGTVFRAATRDDLAKMASNGLMAVNGQPNLPRRLDAGYVKLGDGKWRLTTLDIEHAALDMTGLSSELSRAIERPEAALDDAGNLAGTIAGDIVINPGSSSASRAARTRDAQVILPSGGGVRGRTTHRTVSPPTPRSNGISLVRDGLEDELKADMNHQKVLEARYQSNAAVYLAAEDVTRGYAIDIWDDTEQRWFSLCERTGTFELSSQFLAAGDEAREAAVIPSFAGLKEGIDDVVMHPAYVKWAGWSLAAPLPGKVIESAGGGQPNIDPPDSFPGFPLKSRYRPAPGTLPRLRFGRSYRMRMRAIDLAGNTVPLNEARDDAKVTVGPVRYLRYDPLPAPYLMLRRSPHIAFPGGWKLKKEAEAVDRMVIRSNFDEPTVSHEIPERFVLPPRTAWATAETLGAFDEGGVVSPTVYARFAHPDTAGAHREGAMTADELSEADREVFDDPMQPYEFPYLPDAGTRRVMFRGLPGENGAPMDFEVDLYPGAEEWPDAQLFVIRLLDGTGPPQVVVETVGSKQRRVLLVKVPKGTSYTVRYSSVPEDPRGSSALLEDVQTGTSLTGKQKSNFADLLSRGQVHLYTPARDLLLVHAIRQPRTAPAILSGGWNRAFGATFASLRGLVSLHRASTERITLVADWTEHADVDEDGPTTRAGKAIVADTPVGFVDVPRGISENTVDLRRPETATGSQLPRDVRHEFNDTKHRKVQYTPVASSRFAEYFPHHRESVSFPLTGGDDELSLGQTEIDEATLRVVDAADPETVYQRFVDYDVDATAGKLLRLEDGSIETGQVLNVSFRRTTTRAGAPRTMHIASSARPAAPKVLFVTPAFKWEPEEAPTVSSTTVKSTRHGGILRVWMDRPWYSSGEGEQLGVVVLPSGTVSAEAAAALEPYVTRVAGDPLWRAPAPTSSYVRTEHLPVGRAGAWGRRVTTKTGCALSEVPKRAKPTVAGYDVAFDGVTKRWYADVTMEIKPKPNSLDENYMPFIRLALVRLQPDSLPGVEVSPVVIANFVQLTPTRSATVFREGDDLLVTVQGNTYQEGPRESGPALMSFEIQHPRYGSAAGPEIEYQSVEDPIVVSPDPYETWPIFATWSARIPAPPAGTDARLVIKEFERYEFLSEERPASRLVYMDILDIG